MASLFVAFQTHMKLQVKYPPESPCNIAWIKGKQCAFLAGKSPRHTTAVIMQEKIYGEGTTVYIDDTVSEGKNIRLKGGELEKGQKAFEAGHLISPASMGLIGSLGINSLKVFQKPSIRIITTGNELISPGENRKEGQIYESNSIAISGVLENFGFKYQEKSYLN